MHHACVSPRRLLRWTKSLVAHQSHIERPDWYAWLDLGGAWKLLF